MKSLTRVKGDVLTETLTRTLHLPTADLIHVWLSHDVFESCLYLYVPEIVHTEYNRFG